MTRANRNAVLAAVVAGTVLVGAGCGSQSCANVTPDILQGAAPTSCSFLPNVSVTVKVPWCSCSSSVSCDVQYDNGTYLLDPKVSACDASCPANPDSCPPAPVSCTFVTQPLGSNNSYNILIHGASSDSSATMTVSSGGGSTCG
jgi:hypothetical protein